MRCQVKYWIKNRRIKLELFYSGLKMTFSEAFLNYKKELMEYGYQVSKISLKEKTVVFKKVDE